MLHGSNVYFVGAVVFATFVAGFLGLAVFAISWAVRANGKRHKDLARFAVLRGFSYVQRLPGGKPPALDLRGRVYASPVAQAFLQQFGGFRLFTTGSWRDVKNVMSGCRGSQEWLIFDYGHWTEGRGQQESEIEDVTCVVLRTQHNMGCFSVELKLPLLGRLEALANPSGIVQTGDAPFDARFTVRTTDVGTVPFALNGRVRHFLLDLYQGPQRWYRQLHVLNDRVIITESRASGPHIEDMMAIAEEFVRLAESGHTHTCP